MRRSHPSLAKGIVANRDIEYARVGDNSLRLDLYSPKEPAARRPLIVWVHGGGWRNGSKDRCPALRFLAKGYVVASINYRLSGVAIYPAQIHDCKAAIRWLRAHAEQYSIDPRRIGVWGSSAGGHLVALLGTSGGVEPLEGDLGSLDHSSRVQAVCDFFGPTDFLQMDDHAVPNAPFKHNAPDSPEALVIGGPIQENTKKVEAANPLTYVTPDDPPFFIVHGDKDPLVPLHQSQLLFDALKRAKVNVKLHVVEGGQHGFGRNSDVDKLVDSFFDKQLRANSK
ncbi:MAG: alpha/beta hydrolase [Planctomycetes bacterium]|nr:alpha/beta hydrolase [Planctomycetota bacterium]